MGWLLALLSLALIGVLTAAVLRWAGVPKKSAIWAGVAAGLAAAVLVAAAGIVALGECLNDNASPPPAWYWSPRAQFCDEGFPEALSWLVLFLVPSGLVILGTLLRSRGHASLALVPYAALLAVPALPFLYLDSLDYYRLDSYPVLDQPLLKPDRAGTPPRVCFVYGIVTGPRKVLVTPKTRDHCVELAPTPEALSLTLAYDRGRTVTDLTRMGQNLTQDGLPVTPGRTGVHGLTVRRAFRLPDREARQGAHFPDGYLEGLSKPLLPRRTPGKTAFVMRCGRRGTALVPTATSNVSRSSRSVDARNGLDAPGSIGTRSRSAGGQKVAGSIQSPRLIEVSR